MTAKSMAKALSVHIVPAVFGSVLWIGWPWEADNSALFTLILGGSLAALLTGVLVGERFWGFTYALPGLFLLMGISVGSVLEVIGWLGLYVAIGSFWLLWTPSLLLGATVIGFRHYRRRQPDNALV